MTMMVVCGVYATTPTRRITHDACAGAARSPVGIQLLEGRPGIHPRAILLVVPRSRLVRPLHFDGGGGP
jgi:hypothetical protein